MQRTAECLGAIHLYQKSPIVVQLELIVLTLFPQRAESSLTRTQELNPMVNVTADTDNVDDKADEFFHDFDVICATCCGREALLRINRISHEKNIMFYAGDVYGYYSYMFADLNEHQYAE